MTFPQLQEFLETARPMKMYLHTEEKSSQNKPITIQQPNLQNRVVLPVVFSHMNFLLIQTLCETGHGEFRISTEKKNHELAVYLGSHISYRYLLKPQQLEPIENAYHQVTNTWNQWHYSR